MQMLYKLTDQKGYTYKKNCKWGEGITHKAKGKSNQSLCTDGWIHAYEHPLIALMFNPIHADIKKPILWEAQGVVGIRDHQVKCGCLELTTIKQLEIPKITIVNRVAFGILCAKKVYLEGKFQAWADNWLSNKDRTAIAAYASIDFATGVDNLIIRRTCYNIFDAAYAANFDTVYAAVSSAAFAAVSDAVYASNFDAAFAAIQAAAFAAVSDAVYASVRGDANAAFAAIQAAAFDVDLIPLVNKAMEVK